MQLNPKNLLKFGAFYSEFNAFFPVNVIFLDPLFPFTNSVGIDCI